MKARSNRDGKALLAWIVRFGPNILLLDQWKTILLERYVRYSHFHWKNGSSVMLWLTARYMFSIFLSQKGACQCGEQALVSSWISVRWLGYWKGIGAVTRTEYALMSDFCYRYCFNAFPNFSLSQSHFLLQLQSSGSKNNKKTLKKSTRPPCGCSFRQRRRASCHRCSTRRWGPLSISVSPGKQSSKRLLLISMRVEALRDSVS